MKVIVREHRPLRTVLVIVLVAMCILAAGGALWEHQQRTSGEAMRDVTRRLARAVESNRALEARNDELSRKLSRLERAAQIETEAYARVNADLAALQEELQAVREEVSFYQGVSAGDAESKVRVQRLAVERDAVDGAYVLRLVLARVLKDDNVFRGSVTLAVDGELEGKASRIEHPELLEESARAIGFSFRHFRRIERRLRLPEGFEPKTVVVTIRADGEKKAELEESFAWPS